ncbi:tetratricopeptide repeat protein [Scytonema sp. NUACC26]|uniref:tetratricopeptide repeat protein n=1 Tax=Scytonema sp. NUACC26 TaxID=3140176 RepID=UPI0034DC3A48
MKYSEQTLANFNLIVEKKPKDTKALLQQAETYRLTGQYSEALKDFNEVLKLIPNYVWAFAHRGETYKLMKRYVEALEDFNRAIELNPAYVWAIAHRGVTYRFLGKEYYEKALTDLTRAIELNPNYAWAFAYRCLIYELIGSYKEGLVDFDRAIALDQSLFNHWRSKRGLMLSYDKRYAEALECCEQALKENPNDYLALYCIAVVKVHWQGLSERFC